MKDLEILNRKTLRLITGAHAKSPAEILNLETNTLPISNVITIKRLSYSHTILNRQDSEIVKKVYNLQKKNHSKGDWVKLVYSDMKTYYIDC